MSDESNISPEEEAQAMDPNVGDGTPDTAPWIEPAVPFLKREPIVGALIAANAPLLAGFIGSLTDGAQWYVQVLLGLALVVVNGAGAAARQAVTPTARPRLDSGTALLPARAGEAGYSLVELGVFLLLVAIAAAVVVAFVA